jgi:hypothetical protein
MGEYYSNTQKELKVTFLIVDTSISISEQSIKDRLKIRAWCWKIDKTFSETLSFSMGIDNLEMRISKEHYIVKNNSKKFEDFIKTATNQEKLDEVIKGWQVTKSETTRQFFGGSQQVLILTFSPKK